MMTLGEKKPVRKEFANSFYLSNTFYGHFFLWVSERYRKGSLTIVQELCESRGGRPGLESVLTSLLVSVDVKIY